MGYLTLCATVIVAVTLVTMAMTATFGVEVARMVNALEAT